jgi:hypothetical protein
VLCQSAHSTITTHYPPLSSRAVSDTVGLAMLMASGRRYSGIYQDKTRHFWRAIKLNGGEGGIRTPDSLATMADFESAAFNRALPPLQPQDPFYLTNKRSRNDAPLERSSPKSSCGQHFQFTMRVNRAPRANTTRASLTPGAATSQPPPPSLCRSPAPQESRRHSPA